MAKSLTVKLEDNRDALPHEAADDEIVKANCSLSVSPDSKDEDETIVSPTTFSRPVWPLPKAKSGTPTPSSQRNGSGGGKRMPQLINHLPRAEEAAMKAFEELQENRYQNSRLGRSREALESMTCDCQYAPGQDDPDKACGEGSDCINRLTQVECLEEDCRCRAACQNQRMQRKQHAHIEVVLTEKKGYGLRAGSDIKKDAFIYEYIGDIVSQPTFAKRMREYAEEGIRHFYFMMLQKDEFIDATKRGGVGRFANHSCNPNCYVAKWTIGQHVRMGIFAKRNIMKGEELAFNYNVDRYGHDAQLCYCGEPECVGFLGGKTQTDVAAMDDLYLDALGISEEVELYGLKGNKKKRGKKLDEDYVPVLKSLVEKDIPKVLQAIQQTQSRKVLLKLLTRIKMTEDQPALRQLMRLRGFSLMCNILEDHLAESDICTLVLECISTWPLLQRNKVEDSKIEEPVKKLRLYDDENLRDLAEMLLKQWSELDVGYRIPKRMKVDGEEKELRTNVFEGDFRNFKRHRFDRDLDIFETSEVPRIVPLGRTPVLVPQPAQSEHSLAYALKRFEDTQHTKQSIAEVIAAATRAAEEARRAEEGRIAAAQKAAAEAEEAKVSRKPSEKKKKLSDEEKDALKEKKLMKLVGAVVVRCLSKHQDRFNHDMFKKHAKELTKVISDKEKKSHSYQSGKLDSLSEEKTIKVKKFAKEYIAKLLHRMEKPSSSKSRLHEGVASASSSGFSPRHERDEKGSKVPTPSDSTHPAPEFADYHNVDSLLDLGGDDEGEEEEEDDADESGDPSPASDLIGPVPVPSPSVAIVGRDVDADADVEMRDVSIGAETAQGTQTAANMNFITPSSKLSNGRKESRSSGKRSRWDQPPPGVPPPASSISTPAISLSNSSAFTSSDTNL